MSECAIVQPLSEVATVASHMGRKKGALGKAHQGETPEERKKRYSANRTAKRKALKKDPVKYKALLKKEKGWKKDKGGKYAKVCAENKKLKASVKTLELQVEELCDKMMRQQSYIQRKLPGLI